MRTFDEASKMRGETNHPKRLMLSALCYNMGKGVVSYTDKNGIPHCCDYNADGINVVKNFTERITHSKAIAIYVESMTEQYKKLNKKIESGAKIGKINKIFEDSFNPYMLTLIAVCVECGKVPQNKNKEKILLEYLQKYYKIMAAPYVTKEDLSNAGFFSKRSISKAYSYAHKLRLDGVEKSEALQKTINYMNNSKDLKQTCEV